MELTGLLETFRLVADLEAAELGKQQVAVNTELGDRVFVEPTPQLNRTSEQEARNSGRIPLNAFLTYCHEDKKAKEIFQINLTVMMKKKYISFWHDGLIEPGMRWKDEIDENLERMDVFLALVTNPFLASDFIEKSSLNGHGRDYENRGRIFFLC
jgi:hypothetical protein